MSLVIYQETPGQSVGYHRVMKEHLDSNYTLYLALVQAKGQTPP